MKIRIAIILGTMLLTVVLAAGLGLVWSWVFEDNDTASIASMLSGVTVGLLGFQVGQIAWDRWAD